MFFENIDGILEDPHEKENLQEFFISIIENTKEIKVIFETNFYCLSNYKLL